jgi:glutathione synthase/RimK-type ligase-like ATP-grasp enzyme
VKVLVVTQSEDTGIAATVRALEARGTEVVRLDSDRFPTEVGLAIWQGPGAARSVLVTPEGTLDLREVRAIWFRWIDAGERLPAMDGEYRAAAVCESTLLVESLAVELDAFQLDPIARARRSDNKLYQHRLAADAGLAIPRSLATNDPAEVRAFARWCGTGLVTKMNRRFRRAVGVGDDGVHFEAVMTTRVSEEDLDALDGLDLCPMIFQEEIAKQAELRVTVVGHRVFAAEVDSQATPANRCDWRVDQDANVWRPGRLPPDVERRLLELLTRLGVNYAACDLIRAPDGRHVFLEANCVAGMFTWIEEQTGMPISAAIADLLIGRAPRRA